MSNWINKRETKKQDVEYSHEVYYTVTEATHPRFKQHVNAVQYNEKLVYPVQAVMYTVVRI